MAAAPLTERYAADLHGVLSCYDRKSFTQPDSYLSEPGFAATITGAVRYFVD